MLPGDRLICAFIESKPVGEEFKKWFLHVTIVPWFRLEDSSEQIAKGLERALHEFSAFQAVADEEVLMGPRKRSACLLQLPSPFTEIEPKVRSYLHKKRAWLVDETTKKHYQYRPHVTAQDQTGLESGQKFACDRLYIVEQEGDYKKVVNEIHLV